MLAGRHHRAQVGESLDGSYFGLGGHQRSLNIIGRFSHSKVDDCPIGSLRGITESMELH